MMRVRPAHAKARFNFDGIEAGFLSQKWRSLTIISRVAASFLKLFGLNRRLIDVTGGMVEL